MAKKMPISTGGFEEEPVPEVKGELFGIEFVEEGANAGRFRLLIEDDGFWHRRLSAHVIWLDDLEEVIVKAQAVLRAKKRLAFRRTKHSLESKTGKATGSKKAKR